MCGSHIFLENRNNRFQPFRLRFVLRRAFSYGGFFFLPPSTRAIRSTALNAGNGVVVMLVEENENAERWFAPWATRTLIISFSAFEIFGHVSPTVTIVKPDGLRWNSIRHVARW